MRKALIMNKEYTGMSGYFARRLDLLCSDIVLNKDPDYDCGTKHLVELTVDDKQTLNKLNGLYYKKNKDDRVTRIIDSKKDLHLIGKKLHLRTPVTCASKNGICHKCYGDLAYVNSDIHIGLFAVKELSSKFTQNILSSKHLLKTHSIKLDMTEGFDDFFVMDGGDVLINPLLENRNYYIVINPSEIDIEDSFDEYEFNKSITYFKVRDKKGNIVATIKELNGSRDLIPNKFFISEYLDDFITKSYIDSDGKIVIPLNRLEDNEILFTMQIMNNELTKPLKNIMSLVDTKSHLDCVTISDMAQKFCRLLIDAKLSTMLIHGLIIIRNIIRRTDNILKIPNYKKDDISYEILTVKRALKYHPSVIVSLSFERIEEQLKKPMTYTKRDSSIFDPLFMINYMGYKPYYEKSDSSG